MGRLRTMNRKARRAHARRVQQLARQEFEQRLIRRYSNGTWSGSTRGLLDSNFVVKSRRSSKHYLRNMISNPRVKIKEKLR